MSFFYNVTTATVRATTITGATPAGDQFDVATPDGSLVLSGLRFVPQVGDYVIVQDNNYTYVVPKEQFEETFTPFRT